MESIITQDLRRVYSGGKYNQQSATAINGQMRRYYLRAIPGLSVEKQRHGLPTGRYAPIYEEGRASFPKARNQALASLRERDELCVARLAVLATDRKDLTAVMATLRDKRCAVVETTTGRRSDRLGGFAMFIEAVDYWSARNKVFGNETPAQAGARGGAEASRRRRAGKMPAEAARPIWTDRKYTTDQAVDAINSDVRYARKWSASQLYRDLGPREAKAGRRPRAKIGEKYEG